MKYDHMYVYMLGLNAAYWLCVTSFSTLKIIPNVTVKIIHIYNIFEQFIFNIIINLRV